MTIRSINPAALALPVISALAGFQNASAGPGFSWWVANSLEKIRPFDSAPLNATKVVELCVARNEFESFQIVFRSQAADLPGLDVEVSDLRTSQGAEIGKSNITVYLEHFLDLVRPSSDEG